MKKILALIFSVIMGCLFFVSIARSEVTLGGKLETYGASYFQGRNGNENQFGEIRLQPKLTVTPSENWLIHLEGDFRVDSQNFAHGVINDVVDRGKDRWAINISERYVEYNKETFRIRVGKQMINWSVTDTVSPADNINPRDWKDIVRWERLGVSAVDLKLGGDSFIEAAIMPWFMPSKFPDSRWERELPKGLENGDQEMPSRGHPQFAVRAGTNTGGYDLGASFYKGYSYSPSFKFEPISLTSARIIPVYREEEVYSLSAAKEISGFNVRTEAGYFHQKDEDDFIQYVVGVDREWSSVFRQTDSLYVLLQYANEIITQHDRPVSFKTFDFRRILNNAAIAKVKYSPSDSSKWAANLEGSYNMSGQDYYIQPSLTWKKDKIEAKGGLDIMGGPKDSFFGGYNKNDRAFILLTLYF